MAPPRPRAAGLKRLAAIPAPTVAVALVSIVGGWLLTRATGQLMAGLAGTTGSILVVARAMLRDGVRGNRTVLLVFALVAVLGYAVVMAYLFRAFAE